MDGKGTTEDYQKAFEYFWNAANNGYKRAFYMIGHFHEYGISIPTDKIEAISWFKKGMDDGDNLCKDAYNRLCTELKK